jgi:hypothetical protein
MVIPLATYSHNCNQPTQHGINMVVDTTSARHNLTVSETLTNSQTQPQNQTELWQTANQTQPHKRTTEHDAPRKSLNAFPRRTDSTSDSLKTKNEDGDQPLETNELKPKFLCK